MPWRLRNADPPTTAYSTTEVRILAVWRCHLNIARTHGFRIANAPKVLVGTVCRSSVVAEVCSHRAQGPDQLRSAAYRVWQQGCVRQLRRRGPLRATASPTEPSLPAARASGWSWVAR